MNQLLVICGQTATGKTSLGLKLAKKISGEVISADSRQVYKDMDIGTGKDLPETSKFQKSKNLKLPGFYIVDGVRIWGYDLVSPKKDFSVANYTKATRKIVNDIWERDKLPIIVGGTGLYIKALINGVDTLTVPKNSKLRKSIKEKNIDELFEKLAQMDPVRAAKMNLSDKKNPRRLIRAIEIAQWKIIGKRKLNRRKGLNYDSLLVIGLFAPKGTINRRIETRVENRLEAGILDEIQRLLDSGITWDHQSMDTLGYKEWKDYFEKDLSRQAVVKRWKANEKRYAKRQLAWFKRDKRVNWYDISDKAWRKDIESKVKKWYSSKKASHAN